MGVSTAEGVISVSVIFTGEYKFLFGSLLQLFSLIGIVAGSGEEERDKETFLFGDSNFLKVKFPLEIVLCEWNLKFAKPTAVPSVII